MKLLTLQEVAEQLTIPVSSVRRLVSDKRLECIKLAATYRFSQEAVDKFIAKESKLQQYASVKSRSKKAKEPIAKAAPAAKKESKPANGSVAVATK